MNYDYIPGKEFDEKLIRFRRDFHRYPETGWLEYRTTVKIIEELEKQGIGFIFGADIHSPEYMIGKPSDEQQNQSRLRALEETGRPDLLSRMKNGMTGVVAVLEGSLPGPTVAVRVDIDSNDLGESEDSEHRPFREGFASEHKGWMHACGHDGHTAIGLGLAEILNRNRDRLRGKVLLIFQAAEEGGRGADSLVQKGLFESVDYFFAGHIGLNRASLGTVSASTYGFLASVKFDARFTGKASHAGKAPEEGHNSLAAASTAILNMLAIPRSGKGDSRVNIGTIEGGSGRNVIPDQTFLRAETRGINQTVNDYMYESAMRVCKSAAEMYQCTLSVSIEGRSQTAECDMDFAKLVARSAAGVEGVVEVLDASDLGAGENVAYMMNDVRRRGGKTTFLMLGADIVAEHHSKTFDFDEKVVPLGARLYAKIVFDIGESQADF